MPRGKGRDRTVGRVPHDRQPSRGGLDAELVGPARLGPEPEPAQSARRPAAWDLRNRVTACRAPGSPSAATRATPGTPGGVSQSVQVPEASAVVRASSLRPRATRRRLHDGPVFLGGLPPLELSRQPPGGTRVLRPEEDARDRPVQPMDNPQVDRRRVGRTEVMAHGLLRVSAPPGGAQVPCVNWPAGLLTARQCSSSKRTTSA